MRSLEYAAMYIQTFGFNPAAAPVINSSTRPGTTTLWGILHLPLSAASSASKQHQIQTGLIPTTNPGSHTMVPKLQLETLTIQQQQQRLNPRQPSLLLLKQHLVVLPPSAPTVTYLTMRTPIGPAALVVAAAVVLAARIGSRQAMVHPSPLTTANLMDLSHCCFWHGQTTAHTTQTALAGFWEHLVSSSSS